MGANQHSDLVQRVRDGITWAQDPQWEGYDDALAALDSLIEQVKAYRAGLVRIAEGRHLRYYEDAQKIAREVLGV